MIKNDVPSSSEDKLQEGNKAGDEVGQTAWKQSFIFWRFLIDWLIFLESKQLRSVWVYIYSKETTVKTLFRGPRCDPF